MSFASPSVAHVRRSQDGSLADDFTLPIVGSEPPDCQCLERAFVCFLIAQLVHPDLIFGADEEPIFATGQRVADIPPKLRLPEDVSSDIGPELILTGRNSNSCILGNRVNARVRLA